MAIEILLSLHSMDERIIIIGANGQIGTELAVALRSAFGAKHVIGADINAPDNGDPEVPFETVDVLDRKSLHNVFTAHRPTQVYLLAAMLSATGEKHPREAWDLNINGLLNVLDLALEYGVGKVFWPSSIAVFGPHSVSTNTPQYTVMDPETVYGISKLAGERICAYYHKRYGLDVRSVRYPGIISWKTAPGGGTTDYAIHIFHEALKTNAYTCFLSADTALPMLYMDDAVRGTLALMDAPAEALTIRSSYNISGVSFTPAMLAAEIRTYLPGFEISYQSGDPRQAIADTWPESIEDTLARQEWAWAPQFDLRAITNTMITNLKEKYK